jgi:hypothetical protein
VVAGLIAALPEMRWTAIKITQFGHGVCSANGEPCDCATAEHTIAVSEERLPDAGADERELTDSARYLRAGAERSLWVRTQQGELLEAMPRIRSEIAWAHNVIVESNSLLRFLKPDLYLSVLDPAVRDFKESARRYLDRADAVLVPGGELSGSAWESIAPGLLRRLRVLPMYPPVYVPGEVSRFVRERLQPRLEMPQPA